jgi:prevent-host-death family protein
MNTIGIFEAKTKFAQICEHVHETNESILITKRGVPLVRIEAVHFYPQQASGIWKCRQTFLERYGEWSSDFDLPPREKPLQYENPFEEP